MAPPETEPPFHAPDEKPDARYVAEWERLKRIQSFHDILTDLHRLLSTSTPSKLSRTYVEPALKQFHTLLQEENKKNGGKIPEGDVKKLQEVIEKLPSIMVECDMIQEWMLKRLRTHQDHLNVLCGLLAMYPKHAEKFGMFTQQEKKDSHCIEGEVARGKALVALLSDATVGMIPLNDMVDKYINHENALKFFEGEKNTDVRAAKADALCFLANAMKAQQEYLRIQAFQEPTVIEILPFLSAEAARTKYKEVLGSDPTIGAFTLEEIVMYTDLQRARMFFVLEGTDEGLIGTKADALCFLAKAIMEEKLQYIKQRMSQRPTVAGVLPSLFERARDRYREVIVMSSTNLAEISARLRTVDEMADESEPSMRFFNELGLVTPASRAAFQTFCDQASPKSSLQSPPSSSSGVPEEQIPACQRALHNIYALINTGAEGKLPWSSYLCQFVRGQKYGEPKQNLESRVKSVLQNLNISQGRDLYLLMKSILNVEGELPESPAETSVKDGLKIMCFLATIIAGTQANDEGVRDSGTASVKMLQLYTKALSKANEEDIPEVSVDLAQSLREHQDKVDNPNSVTIIDPTFLGLSGKTWWNIFLDYLVYNRSQRFLSGRYHIGILRSLAGSGGHVSGSIALRDLSPETVNALRTDPLLQGEIQHALEPYDAKGGIWGKYLSKHETEAGELGERIQKTLKVIRRIEFHNSLIDMGRVDIGPKVIFNPARLLRYGLHHTIAFDRGIRSGKDPHIVESVDRQKLPLSKGYLETMAEELKMPAEMQPEGFDVVKERSSLIEEAKLLGYDMTIKSDGSYDIRTQQKIVDGLNQRADVLAQRARALRREDFRRRASSISDRFRGASTSMQDALRQEAYRLQQEARGDSFRLPFRSDYSSFELADLRNTPPHTGPEIDSMADVHTEWKQLLREATESGYDIASHRNIFNVPISSKKLQEFRNKAQNIGERARAVQRRNLRERVSREAKYPFFDRYSQRIDVEPQEAINRLCAEAERHGLKLTFQRNGPGSYSWTLSSQNPSETEEYWKKMEKNYKEDSLKTLRKEFAELKAQASVYGCKLTVDFEDGSYKLGEPVAFPDPLHQFSQSLQALRKQFYEVGRMEPNSPERMAAQEALDKETVRLREIARSEFNISERAFVERIVPSMPYTPLVSPEQASLRLREAHAAVLREALKEELRKELQHEFTDKDALEAKVAERAKAMEADIQREATREVTHERGRNVREWIRETIRKKR